VPFFTACIRARRFVFLLITQTDSSKFFSAIRDFFGSLPGVFIAVYSRLILDFHGGGLAKFSRLAAG